MNLLASPIGSLRQPVGINLWAVGVGWGPARLPDQLQERGENVSRILTCREGSGLSKEKREEGRIEEEERSGWSKGMKVERKGGGGQWEE